MRACERERIGIPLFRPRAERPSVDVIRERAGDAPEEEAPMTTQLHSTLNRIAIALVAATLGVGLFATGVWAGSARNGGEPASVVQPHNSFWGYNARTGYPTGPAGQPDFWNYDPKTGAKISNSSPRMGPLELGALWRVTG
jgi:hypothetical protein